VNRIWFPNAPSGSIPEIQRAQIAIGYPFPISNITPPDPPPIPYPIPTPPDFSYAYTLASFTSELASAMSDPNHVYWAQDELNRIVCEGLLHWGSLTSRWIARGLFSTVIRTPFYDLNVQLPTLRRRNYTFDQIYREIQYHIFEPATGVGGGGTGATDQFTLAQNLSALARRRNIFQIDSRLPLTFATFDLTTPSPEGLVELSRDIALIQRMAWMDATSRITTPLRRTDAFTSQAANPVWNIAPGKPFAYSQTQATPWQLQLIPPPLASGQFSMIYAKTQVVGGTDPLAIPDEFACAVKYGAMYEMFSTNSPGYDPIRSKYCAARYVSALEVTKLQQSIIRVQVNGKLVPLGTLAAMDSSRPFWQTGTGTPQAACTAYDLLGLYKVPDGVYSITCDVSETAPLPVNPTDPIDLGREEIPYLFDYCRHILCLKLGGTEFVQTAPLYDNFLRGAAQRSKLMAYEAPNYTQLLNPAKTQESESHAA
jgi:hypothetical protein